MKLLPLDAPELLLLAAKWLAAKENYQWLDFGNGRQVVTPALLKIMTQREPHFLRIYTWGPDDRPVGIVGLNSVDRAFKTGTLWAVAGEKSFANRGYVSLASSKFLTLAFRDLGLHVVDTWIVDRNPSVRSLGASTSVSSAGGGNVITSTVDPTIGCCSICSPPNIGSSMSSDGTG